MLGAIVRPVVDPRKVEEEGREELARLRPARQDGSRARRRQGRGVALRLQGARRRSERERATVRYAKEADTKRRMANEGRLLQFLRAVVKKRRMRNVGTLRLHASVPGEGGAEG